MKKKVKVEEAKAIKEKCASIKEKALVMAKLDKQIKSGFDVYKLLKFDLICKKINESGAKEQHSKTMEVLQAAWDSSSVKVQQGFNNKATLAAEE